MARYYGSYKGIGQMARSGFMRAEMVARAEKIKVIAEATAPIDSGRYKTSFNISSTSRGGPRGDRAEAKLENTAPYANFVELGTSKYPGHHTIMNAARLAGGG